MHPSTSDRPARAGVGPKGLYLYAVIDTAADQDLGTVGIDGGRVYTLGQGKVAAVVSDLTGTKLRPERSRLAAHHEVLRQLRERHTVLPMIFGIVTDGPGSIRRILARNEAALLGQIRRVTGKVEMGLRVAWDVPNIFEYMVCLREELRTLRDHLFRSGREPSQRDKIELGRLFDRVLGEERAEQTGKVLAVLRPRCAEVKENKPRKEQEVMNLAFLIGREQQGRFEEGVFEAARQFDNNYAFDFTGPWPPHNFVEVNLEL